MKIYKCWGHILPESELYSIFGDRPVPLQSIFPFIPREEGCPPCYLVLLDPEKHREQFEAMAQKLYEKWRPECASLLQAKEYLSSNGLPLQQKHFISVGTDRNIALEWGDDDFFDRDEWQGEVAWDEDD